MCVRVPPVHSPCIKIPLSWQAPLSDSQRKTAELSSARKKLNFNEGSAGGSGGGGGGGEGGGGKVGTPTLHRSGGLGGSGTQPREQQSSLVSVPQWTTGLVRHVGWSRSRPGNGL